MDSDPSAHAPASTLADIPLRQRVAQVRYDINWQGTAVRMQYERLVSHINLPIEERTFAHLRGIADLDFLVISIYRLLNVAKRAKEFGCDTDGKLRLAIHLFESQWFSRLKELRNALEHLDHGGIGIVPVQGGGSISFVWSTGQVDAHKLYTAADRLITTICRVIEPLESASSQA
jgi:hypothetical protein